MFNTVLDTTCLQERKKFRPKASIYGQILPDSALVGEDPTPAAQITMSIFASYTVSCFRIPPGKMMKKCVLLIGVIAINHHWEGSICKLVSLDGNERSSSAKQGGKISATI